MKIGSTSFQSICSPTHHSFQGFSSPRNLSYKKKRIGPYYYYLEDSIGSGYSSKVFKGFNELRPGSTFAIKVIRLEGLNKAKKELLQNEIKILKDINHQNLLNLEEIFYTPNNCYIITEFCQGGTLQNHIEANPNLDWEDVCSQMTLALSYLSDKCIVHRDIKPANIFLKGATWKIGDFGFSRYLPSKSSQVQELYMVGSPLYMPPETLEKKIYSLKTDCFAFGILLFHLVTREFPWSGNTKKELLLNYANCKYPSQKIAHLASHYQLLLKGLCEIQISRRINVEDLDFFVKQADIQTVSSIQDEENDFMDRLKNIFKDKDFTNVSKITLCKFIHYIDCNIQHFEDMCDLSESLRRVLKTLSLAFGWDKGSSFSRYMDEFKCGNHQEIIEEGEMLNIKLLAHTKKQSLKGSQIPRCVVLRRKLEQLGGIFEQILKNSEKSCMKEKISGLVLHPDFSRANMSY